MDVNLFLSMEDISIFWSAYQDEGYFDLDEFLNESLPDMKPEFAKIYAQKFREFADKLDLIKEG